MTSSIQHKVLKQKALPELQSSLLLVDKFPAAKDLEGDYNVSVLING
jgi:hypothetical protein